MSEPDFDTLIEQYMAAPPEDAERIFLEFAKLPEGVLLHRKAELLERLATANEEVSGAMNRLALFHLVLGEPTGSLEPFRPEDAGTEIALRALALLRRIGGRLDPDDASSAADEPEIPDQFGSCRAAAHSLGEHLKTAAYYLLDAAASHAALASEPPHGETFPPLPFPQVWIEMAHLAPYAQFHGRETDDPDPALILGVGIVEIEQGRVWDVFVPYEMAGRPDPELVHTLALRIAPGQVIIPDPGLGELSEAAFAPVRQLVVGGVHLITARNAPLHTVTMQRGQRRRVEREHGFEPSARLYFVDIGAAGEHAPGEGGRVYTVRWLVRGHWRHSTSGRTFCTCCDPPQIASWVAPYVKGPPGAPWKGRQVRRQAA